jgi:hypothetical protein
MPSAEENAENACDDGDEKCANKEIGRKRESTTCFAHAAEIEDSDEDQNAHAERNGVRQQGRNGRD